MKILIIFLILSLSGCSYYQSDLHIKVTGTDIKSVHGLIGDGIVEIRRSRSFGTNKK